MAKSNYSTYIAIKNQLLDIMRNEKFEKNKLPSEPILAQRLGISLVTLRESLLMLALEGYITKRHGSGNYIHPSTLDFENRSIYFADCLRQAGYNATVKVISREYVKADAVHAEALKLPPDAPLLKTKVLYQADGKTAIYTQSFIPCNLLLNKNIEEMSFEHLHEVVWQFCQRALAHALNEYQPALVNKELSEILDMKKGAALFCCKQIYYDTFDVPVVYNHHYFNPSLYTVRTLQNWDLNQANS